MALFALVVGSAVGFSIGLISFVFLDFSVLASFGIYQATGIITAFSIIILKTFSGSQLHNSEHPAHAMNA